MYMHCIANIYIYIFVFCSYIEFGMSKKMLVPQWPKELRQCHHLNPEGELEMARCLVLGCPEPFVKILPV